MSRTPKEIHAEIVARRDAHAAAVERIGPPPKPTTDAILAPHGLDRIEAWSDHVLEVARWEHRGGVITEAELEAKTTTILAERAEKRANYERAVARQRRSEALHEHAANEARRFTDDDAALTWTCPHPRGWVYFVQVAETGPVKIGVTGDVARRMAELQTGCPWPLRLLAVAPAAPHTEAELHRAFAPMRMRDNGEWFIAAAELLDFADDLRRRYMPLFDLGVYPPWGAGDSLEAAA